MKQLTPKQLNRWENTRRKGRKHFIWLRGVVCWGLPVAVTWSLLMGAWQGWDRLLWNLPIALILFPIGGYFWGASMWNMFEKLYEESSQSNSDDK